MARETKVGLLAGLAFIICFAIILANRGGQQAVTTQLPYLAQRRTNPPRTAPRARARTDNRRGVMNRARPSGPATPALTRRPGRSKPAPADRIDAVKTPIPPPASGADVLLTKQVARVERSNAVSTAAPPAEQPERKTPGKLGAGTATLAAVTAPTGAAPQAGPRAAPAAASPPKQVARYTVKPGDTLSKIAATRYGSRSWKVIKAIFDSNRSFLTDPDVLPVNVELVLPVIRGFSAPISDRAVSFESTVRRARRTRGTAARRFRWYQIRKHDRYISIARKQLGDERRWREIYELNKDKFPDPQRIREGVRIKLPANSGRGALQSVDSLTGTNDARGVNGWRP